MRTFLLVTSLTVAAASVAPGADEKPDHLGEAIEAVRSAKTPAGAGRAYARGRNADARSAALHEAYMKRMLTFGLPKVAYYPAKALVRLDPDHGTAWGTIAYVEAKRGDIRDALPAAIRSVQHKRRDDSLLHNAAQLIAWYDRQRPRPKLDDALRRVLAKMRDDLRTHETFAATYKQVTRAYEKRKENAEQAGKDLTAAQQAYRRALDDTIDVDEEIREIEEKIRRGERELERLKYGYDYYYSYPSATIVTAPRVHRPRVVTVPTVHRTWTPWSGGVVYRDGHFGGHLRIGTVRSHVTTSTVVIPPIHAAERIFYYGPGSRRSVRRVEKAVKALQTARDGLRKQGRPLLNELADRRDRMEKLRKQVSAEELPIVEGFRWDPPEVNGKVTDERTVAFTRPPEGDAEEDPETDAANKLRLARLYLKNHMAGKARETLEALLEDYPRTPAAAEAKKLLETVGSLPR